MIVTACFVQSLSVLYSLSQFPSLVAAVKLVRCGDNYLLKKEISSDVTMPTYFPLAISVAEKAMREFCQQWYSGLQPCLSLETSADGEISVGSRVIAGDVSTTQPRDAHHAWPC